MAKDGYSGTIQEPVFNILKVWTSVQTFHRVQWVLSTPRLAAGEIQRFRQATPHFSRLQRLPEVHENHWGSSPKPAMTTKNRACSAPLCPELPCDPPNCRTKNQGTEATCLGKWPSEAEHGRRVWKGFKAAFYYRVSRQPELHENVSKDCTCPSLVGVHSSCKNPLWGSPIPLRTKKLQTYRPEASNHSLGAEDTGQGVGSPYLCTRGTVSSGTVHPP